MGYIFFVFAKVFPGAKQPSRNHAPEFNWLEAASSCFPESCTLMFHQSMAADAITGTTVSAFSRVLLQVQPNTQHGSCCCGWHDAR